MGLSKLVSEERGRTYERRTAMQNVFLHYAKEVLKRVLCALTKRPLLNRIIIDEYVPRISISRSIAPLQGGKTYCPTSANFS